MAYSTDLRKAAIKLLNEGKTQKEVSELLAVSVSAIKVWNKLLAETGSVERKARSKGAYKYNDDELRAYVANNPAATLKEIASHFNGNWSGIDKALTRLKITLKKTHRIIESEMK